MIELKCQPGVFLQVGHQIERSCFGLFCLLNVYQPQRYTGRHCRVARQWFGQPGLLWGTDLWQACGLKMGRSKSMVPTHARTHACTVKHTAIQTIIICGEKTFCGDKQRECNCFWWIQKEFGGNECIDNEHNYQSHEDGPWCGQFTCYLDVDAKGHIQKTCYPTLCRLRSGADRKWVCLKWNVSGTDNLHIMYLYLAIEHLSGTRA